MDLQVPELGTILGIWAHPDDEAYLMAGVMALAADAGQRVTCLTATLGDAGETADAGRWPRERLREVRRDELHACLEVLGVEEHTSLEMPDGRLADLDAGLAMARLVEEIDRVQPDTIITFGPDGMTGHLDHRTVSGWVDAAVGRNGSPARVLWATKTPQWMAAFPEFNDEVFPPGLPPQTDPDQALELDLDDATLERKVRALEAHASQTSGLIGAMGRATYASWVRLEAFVPAAHAVDSDQGA